MGGKNKCVPDGGFHLGGEPLPLGVSGGMVIFMAWGECQDNDTANAFPDGILLLTKDVAEKGALAEDGALAKGHTLVIAPLKILVERITGSGSPQQISSAGNGVTQVDDSAVMAIPNQGGEPRQKSRVTPRAIISLMVTTAVTSRCSSKKCIALS